MSAPRQPVSPADIDKMASLARLALNPDEAGRYADSLNHILTLMDRLQAIDTEQVRPLRHPFDGIQPLRSDVADAVIDREAFQQVASAHQDGLYLVPRVIE